MCCEDEKSPTTKTETAVKKESTSNLASSPFSDLQIAIQEAQDAGASSPQHVNFLAQLQQFDGLIEASRTFPVYVGIRSIAILSNTIRVELGTSPMPNQTRTHKHGDFDYRFETRSQEWTVYADVTHPTISEIQNDVIECCRNAAVASVITAVVTENPSAGYAIFFPAFRACMYAKIQERVNSIDVSLGKDTRTGCWTNHCD